MQRDLHHNINLARAISAIAIGTTGTGQTSGIIDRAGYQGVEFIFNYGTITATNAVFTPLLTECDTTGGSFTSVADVDMLGTEVLAGVAAAVRTSGVSKNVNKKLGYIGAKRYLKIKVSSTVTAGTPIGVDALLHSPNHGPAGATQL